MSTKHAALVRGNISPGNIPISQPVEPAGEAREIIVEGLNTGGAEGVVGHRTASMANKTRTASTCIVTRYACRRA